MVALDSELSLQLEGEVTHHSEASLAILTELVEVLEPVASLFRNSMEELVEGCP